MSANDQFFDGGWCWMAHPDYNDGNPIPVKMEAAEGGRWFIPLDPRGASEHPWDQRDAAWEMVQPPTADADAEFDLYCARVAGWHLAALVDELRAEIAALRP